MITLKELLAVPRFSDLMLLTKKSDTNTPVSHIEITETPDIANYTSSNTLLLTTAMVYKDNQQDLKQLIDSLAAINVAGLAIKIGRFITTIDPEIIAYADKKKFPLIQIPITHPLGGVLQKMSNYINQTKTEEISYALDIQKQFSNLILNDASIAKIINEFSRIVKCPIMIVDPFKEIVESSYDSTDYAKPAEFFVTQLNKKKAFESSLTDTSNFISINDHTQIEVSVYPIKSNNFFPYYLIIISPEKIPYPVSAFAIDQALLVLSFVLLKNEKIYDSQKQMKGDYFLNLIERQEHSIFDEKNWLTYDSTFGVQFSQFYQLIYVTMDNPHANKQQLKMNEEKMRLAYHWLEKKVANYFDDALIFPEKNSSNLIIMLQHPISQAKLTDVLILLAGQLKQALPIDLLFSCGQVCDSIDLISTSLIEAKIISEEGKSKLNTNSVSFYRPKGIINLFDTMHKEETKYFCQNTLKELAYPSESIHLELRKTLKTFLDNQCEITKTANELFIHRNTVKYRIDNCEELLGVEISHPQNSLNIRLALELSQ